jgi:hypothetical protein
MDDAKRKALWEAHFEADFRHRYFLALKSRMARRLVWLSGGIAFLSCGPLVALLWQVGASQWLSLSGVIAGAIGVYVGTSGLPRSLAVATQAATAWGHASSSLALLWTRCESREDVWAEFLRLEHDLKWIDALATEHLDTNNKPLIDASWAQSKAAFPRA